MSQKFIQSNSINSDVELHGELCAAHPENTTKLLNIWSDVSDQHKNDHLVIWKRRLFGDWPIST
jgi:hypothetical protein